MNNKTESLWMTKKKKLINQKKNRENWVKNWLNSYIHSSIGFFSWCGNDGVLLKAARLTQFFFNGHAITSSCVSMHQTWYRHMYNDIERGRMDHIQTWTTTQHTLSNVWRLHLVTCAWWTLRYCPLPRGIIILLYFSNWFHLRTIYEYLSRR